MLLAQYLLSIATRHELAMEEHQEELKDRPRKKSSARSRSRPHLTYGDETALLKGVISTVRGKPPCLRKVTPAGIGALAYIIKAKMANDPCIEGYEIVGMLVCDPELTIQYLNALAELQELGWIHLLETPGLTFTDQPPFSYLQAQIELGDTFHKEMGESHQSRSFSSNDDYLDAVFTYLQALIQEDSGHHRISEHDTDLSAFEPESWFRLITSKVQNSNCKLSAVETRDKYSLSTLQHLTMIGLLGMRDNDLRYDFCDSDDVARLFAKGRICRKKVKEHLFGVQSQLMRSKLVEGTQGTFGETVQLTQLGITALIGRATGKRTARELKNRVKKQTLFDIEEPKIRKESVLLPPTVIEAINSIIFSESRKGRQIRKSWHSSLPAAWGSPTGSTVLLYGPPGTGKSLTAQFLASELKVPLLKIDAARVLSCWVGESEQQVRRIFDDYSMLQKEFGTSPVLLFNEADQLLGTRGAGTNSVDRMNNNMQNLFLEGLERFSGVLVATSNRRDLLDEAFSRRFTYKLELPPPDRNIRIEIWKSHLPLKRLAGDVDIAALADLGLSGGEIRLVIERAVRLLAYRGVESIDHKTLTDIAKEEIASRMKRNGTLGNIGFGAVIKS